MAKLSKTKTKNLQALPVISKPSLRHQKETLAWTAVRLHVMRSIAQAFQRVRSLSLNEIGFASSFASARILGSLL